MFAVFMLNQMNQKCRSAQNKKTSSKLNMKNLAMEQCRTCLGTKELVSIFYNKPTDKKRAADLKLVTGLEIQMDDGLPQKICNRCIDKMNLALHFRRMSRKADKSLKSMISNKKDRKNPLPAPVEITIKSPKLKKAKVKNEPVEMNLEYDNSAYADDFQNEEFSCEPAVEVKTDEYPHVKEEEQPVKQFVMKSSPSTAKKKKRSTIPTASSYKCATCDKEFRMKTTYRAHMRFHTNYCVCETCGKRCRNNNQLQEHKRALHGLGRIHKCAFCEYSSATKEALTIHERRHTGERPYICDHCGASFHRRANLVQHIAIHLPDKNFQCDMCPKRLKSRKFLQIHRHNAHTGKRYGYLCPICEHRFEKPNKVRAHTRRVHGVPDDRQGAIARVQL